MPDWIARDPGQIDAKTGRTVAAAIGERLRIDIRLEESEVPVRLQILLDQLSAQDGTPDGVSRAASISGIQSRP
ncbi:MAG: hypothetical protein NTAFB05_10110 [Nitrobacter sp.]|uniref:hypothetical protein n=1 Tax=Nitrobacter sp. TaxID=29420 RepID=UPI00387DE9D3